MSFLSRRKRPERKERVIEIILPAKKQEQLIVPPTTQPVVVKKRQKSTARIDDVTAVIVNFKTLWLTQQAYTSLTEFYNIQVVVVDNGSNDQKTTEWIKSVGGICNSDNLGHGPAMHNAIKTIKTKYVLTFDSDCIVHSAGWLEEMLAENVYAIGWLRYVDRFTGVPLEWHIKKPPSERFVPYVHPAVGLYEVEKYHTLRPFFNHGAPALWNMIDAEAKGYTVKDYPVFRFVTHLIAGTRRMYDGRWNPSSSEQPKEWKKKQSFPI